MDSARLLLILVAVAAASLIGVGGAASDDRLVFSNYTCSAPENYTSGSSYAKNLAKLLSTLSRPAAVDNWWFGNLTVISASPDDQASGLAMCFADFDPDRCRSCLAVVSSATVLFPACERSRDVGYISSDGCVIHYAGGGAPFFGYAVDANSGARRVLRSITQAADADADAMRNARRALLSRLAESASGDDRRFATGSQGYMDAAGRRTWQVMYGMAQCTRDLSPAGCSGCLMNHLRIMDSDVSVTNSTEASVIGFSCYLTYQMNKPIHIAGIAVSLAALPGPPTAEAPTGCAAPPSPVGKMTVFIAAVIAAAVTFFGVGV